MNAEPAAEVASLWPFLIYSLSVVALLVVTVGAAFLIGSRTRHNATTDLPYESGVVPVGDADHLRLSIEFYLVAMFFVIFDLETIFIFAWAVAFFEVGWTGYITAAVFITILFAALIYEFSTGALDWGVRERNRRGRYATLKDGANA